LSLLDELVEPVPVEPVPLAEPVGVVEPVAYGIIRPLTGLVISSPPVPS
jgi:hypothetical protein